MNHHLCYSCKNAKREKVETKKTVYVSYACKIKEKDVDYHRIVIRLPQTNHVLECPKYSKVSKVEVWKRKFFWWIA